MEVVVFILIGLATAGGAVAARSIRRIRRIDIAARRMKFEVGKPTSSDPALDPRCAIGEFRGVAARIGQLETTDGTLDYSANVPSNQKGELRVVCGLEFPMREGYLMSILRTAPRELHVLRSERFLFDPREWDEQPEFDDPTIERLELSFHVREESDRHAIWLRDTERVEVLIELAQNYPIVRVFDGWIWIGGEHFDPDLLDVDFEHLYEARRKLIE